MTLPDEDVGPAPRDDRKPLAFLRALNGRRVGVMGCEREPFAAIFAAGAGLMFLALAALSPLSLAVGLAIWAVGVPALRALARHDPMFWRVYRRSRRYRAFYPGRATRWKR